MKYMYGVLNKKFYDIFFTNTVFLLCVILSLAIIYRDISLRHFLFKVKTHIIIIIEIGNFGFISSVKNKEKVLKN